MFSMLRRKISAKEIKQNRRSSWKPSVEALEDRTLLSVIASATYQGHTYHMLNRQLWRSSEAEAISLGGHLVTINDLAENNFVRDFASPYVHAPDRGVWIGLNDVAVEGQFTWVDGSTASFRNWFPGEPNNFGVGQDFGLIYVAAGDSRFGKWDDDYEFDSNQFGGAVVEIARPDIAVTSAQLPNGNTVQFTYQTTGNPGPFQAGLYRSADATFDTSDTLIDTKTVTPSPTNPQAPGSFTLPQPLPGDPSQPYLLVVADPPSAAQPHGSIEESNEDNNVIAVNLRPLQILGASVTTSGIRPIEMGQTYRLQVTVQENAPGFNPAFVTTSVTEMALNNTLAFGDRLVGFPPSPQDGLSTNGKLLTLGVPANFVFPEPLGIYEYQHSWNWLGKFNVGPGELLETLLFPTLEFASEAGIFSDVARLLTGGAISFTDFSSLLRHNYEARGDVIPEGKYGYAITATDTVNDDSVLGPQVTVVVPEYKRNEFDAYWDVALLQAVATQVGFRVRHILPELTVPLFAVEALALGFSYVAYEIARDPDPDFTQMAAAQPIDLPSVNDLSNSTGKQLAESWVQALVDEKAMGTSLGRYEGAKLAGSQEWMLKQLQAARGFQANLADDVAAVRTATSALLSDPLLQDLTLDAGFLASVKAQLIAGGLPQEEVEILEQLGFTRDQIQSAAAVTAGLSDYVPLHWQDLLASGTDAVSALTTDVGNWADERMRQLSPSNAPPVLNPVTDRIVDEGSTLSFKLSATDPNPGQVVTFSLDSAPAGATIDSATGILTWTPSDGPAPAQVTVRVIDSGSPRLSDTKTFTITVNNAAPMLQPIQGSDLGVRGQPLSSFDVFTDPGVLDTHTASIQWGDGSTSVATVLEANGSGSATGQHVYATNGTYTVTMTITDKDGAASSVTKQVTIQSVAVEQGQLFVGGTPSDDHIEIKQKDDQVIVKLHDGDKQDFQVPLAGLVRLVVYGQGGGDHIQVDKKITLPAFLFAGDGSNAHIEGGGGPTVEVGGNGQDHLVGGDGASILIGGRGSDHLEGKKGDTILIGGTTFYDNSLPSLIGLLDEWSRTDATYPQRVDHIMGTAGGKNIGFDLMTGRVFDDLVLDQLDSGSALDLIFMSLGDELAGNHKGEVIGKI